MLEDEIVQAWENDSELKENEIRTSIQRHYLYIQYRVASF
jgi:hypothetical protein